MPDHVHLFVTAHPIFAPANIAKIFKGITAKKLFEKHPEPQEISFGMDISGIRLIMLAPVEMRPKM